MLLQGAARLEIGDELIELATGDCVTFDQRSPRRVTAIGPESLVVLAVVSPPAI